LWIIGLEPAGTFRSADHIAGLVSAQGFACRWSGSRPDNQTPENGRQRVYRGGSWKSRMSSLRATARAFNEPSYLANDVGFRVVCECA
jgi:formylglycine-generating enzyme required for sulfatase activity